MGDPDVFAPSPWEAYTYDANDNAGRTHGAAAEAYRDHWNTPGSIALLYRDPAGHPHLFTGDCLFPGGVGNTRGDTEAFAMGNGEMCR